MNPADLTAWEVQVSHGNGWTWVNTPSGDWFRGATVEIVGAKVRAEYPTGQARIRKVSR